MAVLGGSDETAHNNDRVLCNGRDALLQQSVRFVEQWLRLREAVVGDDDAARIHMLACAYRPREAHR